MEQVPDATHSISGLGTDRKNSKGRSRIDSCRSLWCRNSRYTTGSILWSVSVLEFRLSPSWRPFESNSHSNHLNTGQDRLALEHSRMRYARSKLQNWRFFGNGERGYRWSRGQYGHRLCWSKPLDQEYWRASCRWTDGNAGYAKRYWVSLYREVPNDALIGRFRCWECKPGASAIQASATRGYHFTLSFGPISGRFDRRVWLHQSLFTVVDLYSLGSHQVYFTTSRGKKDMNLSGHTFTKYDSTSRSMNLSGRSLSLGILMGTDQWSTQRNGGKSEYVSKLFHGALEPD